MRKTTLLLLIVFTTGINFIYAQVSQWTWMSGDSLVNVAGVYGTPGVAGTLNKPGFRQYPASWTDTSGNLWLFGGSFMNDLWKYDVATNLWTWVNGDSTADINGIYGTKGVANAANKPGGRLRAATWTDAAGNLWLFGGYGYAATGGIADLNDLWKYDIANNTWTWINGNNTGNNNSIHGTKGVAAPGNAPGGVNGAVSLTDNAGNLWLFSGAGYGNSGSGFLNALWKYDIATNQWTWVSGDNTRNNNTGVYGIKGTADAANKPPSREGAVGWADLQGNLWFFGGANVGSLGTRYLSDLWKYNIASNQWTWVNGDSSVNQNSVYGTKGTPAATNKPGGRYYGVSGTDSAGNLWLFSGLGHHSTGINTYYQNDLWRYNTGTNQWTWISGDNPGFNMALPGVYGIKRVAAPANKPGSRYGAVSWTDKARNLWVFGGAGFDGPGTFDVLNDLWRLNIDACTPAIAGTLSTPADSVCQPGTASLTVSAYSGNIQWQVSATGNMFTDITGETLPVYNAAQLQQTTYYRVWANNNCEADTSPVLKVTVLPQPAAIVAATDTLICSGDSAQVCVTPAFSAYLWNTGSTAGCIQAKNAGGYWLTVTDANGCSAVSGRSNIWVYPVSPVSIIIKGDTLLSFNSTNYQWFLNGAPIPGATGAVYVPNQSGDYAVQIVDSNGCRVTSSPITFVYNSIHEAGGSINIYPNPFGNQGIWLQVNEELRGSRADVYDAGGRIVHSQAISESNTVMQWQAESGIYFLRITHPGGTATKKLVKL